MPAYCGRTVPEDVGSQGQAGPSPKKQKFFAGREGNAGVFSRERGRWRVCACVSERDVEGTESRLCLPPPPCLLPNPTKVGRCPGYRRPRALDAGCSQFPHQGRLSKTWHGFQGELVICLVSCRLEKASQAARDWGRRIARRQGDSPVPVPASGYGYRSRRRPACFFSSSPPSACQKSMMCSRDRDPHRSKLDSCPAADVSMPAARRQGAQRLPPTRLDRTALGLRLAQRRLRSHKVENRVVGWATGCVGGVGHQGKVACAGGTTRIKYPGNALSSGPGHRCRPIPPSLDIHFDEMLFSIGVG